MKSTILICSALLLGAPLSGCALFAAGGAGYMVHDEVNEADGEFDPLEKVRDQENESN